MKRLLFVILCFAITLQIQALDYPDKTVEKTVMLGETFDINPASDLGLYDEEIMEYCYDVTIDEYNTSAFNVTEHEFKTNYYWRSGTWSNTIRGNYSIFTIETKKKGNYTIKTTVEYMYKHYGTGASNKTSTVTYNIKVLTVESITLFPNPLELKEGGAYQLGYSLSPQGATSTLTWSSSNQNVATVNYDGVVTANKAGTATITCKASNGVKGTCTVNVIGNTIPVSSITLDKTNIEISSGSTSQLSATVSPSNASNKSVTWSSNKTSVATIDNNGLVTGVGVGSAVITCEANDGSGVKATCNVSVKEATVLVTNINLSATLMNITQGSTHQLTATISPTNATDKSVKWSSNKTSVATVDNNGLVTGVAAGSAVITCAAQDGSGVKATCTVTVKAATVFVTQITLNATSKEITQGQTFQLTATVSPTNATDKSVKWSSNKTSVATVDNNGLVTGVAAGSAVITCEAKDGSGVKATCNITVKAQSSGNNIQFADAEVKRICVENWDTDGDGELSKDEAAAVTSLDKAFMSNSQISSFDELEFFTGLLNIGNNEFNGCSSLTSITIPSSVTSFGDSAFRGCSSLTSITIPSSVTTIEKNLFYGCRSLTSITIPSSVTSIGGGAFTGCSSLTSITIPSSVTSIGSSAFSGCSSLTSIAIPSPVTSIGSTAFYSCSSLTSITIPSSVTSIGGNAFSGCSSLTSITIPSSMTNIENNLFYGCRSLTSITIPSSVTSIGGGAFSGCRSLTSITIPSSVTSIGGGAFSGCSSLTSITIPSSVTSIGSSAFSGCSSLTSISIPSSVTSIGNGTFYGCSSLTSVTIPSSVTSIGSSAFRDCSSLTSIMIPSSVTNIEFGLDCAFAYCDNLRKMTVAENNPSYRSKNNGIIDKPTNMLVCSCPGTKIPTDVVGIGEYGFSHVRGVEEIVIPNNIKRIGEYAFSYSLNLKRITIPFGIESIGDFAFYGCTELEQVAIYNPIPVNINDCVFYVSEDGILSSLFGIRYTFTDATLYVPYGSKTQYEQANGWKNFKSIIEMDALSGDVNSDGQVGIGDIVAVTNVMAGNGGNITEAQADVNGDGQVGIGDIVAITNIMAGQAASRQR